MWRMPRTEGLTLPLVSARVTVHPFGIVELVVRFNEMTLEEAYPGFVHVPENWKTPDP